MHLHGFSSTWKPSQPPDVPDRPIKSTSASASKRAAAMVGAITVGLSEHRPSREILVPETERNVPP